MTRFKYAQIWRNWVGAAGRFVRLVVGAKVDIVSGVANWVDRSQSFRSRISSEM